MTKWTWPHTLTVKFARAAKSEPAVNLIVYLAIRMTSKCDFWFGPFVTDRAGMIKLSGEMLDGEIDETIDLALMDYIRPMGNVATISIEVPSRDDLQRRIRQSKRCYPVNAKRLALLITTCVNNVHTYEVRRMIESGRNAKTIRILLNDRE